VIEAGRVAQAHRVRGGEQAVDLPVR
jgi:hypothetical protein